MFYLRLGMPWIRSVFYLIVTVLSEFLLSASRFAMEKHMIYLLLGRSCKTSISYLLLGMPWTNSTCYKGLYLTLGMSWAILILFNMILGMSCKTSLYLLLGMPWKNEF